MINKGCTGLSPDTGGALPSPGVRDDFSSAWAGRGVAGAEMALQGLAASVAVAGARIDTAHD